MDVPAGWQPDQVDFIGEEDGSRRLIRPISTYFSVGLRLRASVSSWSGSKSVMSKTGRKAQHLPAF